MFLFFSPPWQNLHCSCLPTVSPRVWAGLWLWAAPSAGLGCAVPIRGEASLSDVVSAAFCAEKRVLFANGCPRCPLGGSGGGEGEVLYVGRGFKTLKTLKMPPGAACRLQVLRWKGRPSAPRAPGVGGSGTGQRAIPWGVQGQSPWLEESWWASWGCGWRSFGVC